MHCSLFSLGVLDVLDASLLGGAAAACSPSACLMQAAWVVLLQDYDYDAPVKLLDKVGVPTAL